VWTDFQLYFVAIWANAKWLLAGGPYFLEGLVKRLFPDWWENNVDAQWPPAKRTRIEIVIMLAGVFLSGFFAWRDEHILKVAAETTITSLQAELAQKRAEDPSSRLKSQIRELANFPNGPETSQPTTLFQTMDMDKLPHRLFDLLSRYDETQILSVGKNGDALYRFKNDYYRFQSNVVSWEDDLTTRIGHMVTAPFRQAWVIYLQYAIMRFRGLSKEEIIERGNFLNYDITLDDAERVFTKLSDEPSVTQSTLHVLSFQRQMSADARTAMSDI
jgi:hypothetical protein